jgi:hypothetical protein
LKDKYNFAKLPTIPVDVGTRISASWNSPWLLHEGKVTAVHTSNNIGKLVLQEYSVLVLLLLV